MADANDKKQATAENLYIQGKMDKAYKLLSELSKTGNPQVMFLLGECFRYGHGVPESEEEALKWYEKGADKNHLLSSCGKASLIKEPEERNDVLSRLREPLERSAYDGNVFACHMLSVCYLYGRGVPEDPAKAIDFCTRAANQGYALAQYHLGLYCSKGIGVTRNPKEALKWFEKAAEQGYAAAQYKVGIHYSEEGADAKSRTTGAKWFLKAAEQGHALSQYQVALCYYNGSGLMLSVKKSAQWFQKSADQGYDWAMFRLANCYKYGYGVNRDKRMAEELYEKAKKRNNPELLQALKNET
ncbi:MAG: sel1 repeat family protein [Oscillospiraceae bacterium]|nr:sel1 repeat family protein [Oscillospiraceae bacterium]